MSLQATAISPYPADRAPSPNRLDAQAGYEWEGLGLLSVAWILLVAALLIGALVFGAVNAWAWASLTILALISLMLWATASVRQRVLRIAWSPLYLPALFFLVLAIIQLFARATLDFVATRESLLKLITDLILFFLAVQFWSGGAKGTASDSLPDARLNGGNDHPGPGIKVGTNSQDAWRLFGLTVTIFTFGMSIFAILQFFSSEGLIYWTVRPRWGGSIFGPYVNHNHYAGLMEMLIALSAGYCLSAARFSRWGFRKRSSSSRTFSARVFLGFVILVPITSLLLSGSRGGLISLLAEVCLFGAIALRPTTRSRNFRMVVAGTLVIIPTVVFFLWLAPQGTLERFAAIANFVRGPEATLGERAILTRDSIRIFRDHPWLGVGLGNFRIVYPRYQSFASNYEFDHAHNDYAEALAETGLAGGLLIAWALVTFFMLAFRNLDERLKRREGWIQLGAAIGCCGLLVHSFSDFNLHIPANAAWFSVLAGISIASVERREARG